MFTLGLLKPNAITDEIMDAAVQLTNPFDSCINIHHRIVPPLTERMKKTFNFGADDVDLGGEQRRRSQESHPVAVTNLQAVNFGDFVIAAVAVAKLQDLQIN